MELQEDAHREGTLHISRHDTNRIVISGTEFTQPFLLSSSRTAEWIPFDWSLVLQWQPELVLLGCHDVDDATLAPLFDANISVERMSTASACRTFNALAHEGRDVVAAFAMDVSE